MDYEVAIIGGGPAGLSAAITLGRCRRRVIVFDHGKPRNAAALEVHGYLGLPSVSPFELRELGRKQAASYDVEFCDCEVIDAQCLSQQSKAASRFEIRAAHRPPVFARKLLLATGVKDFLPEIDGVRDFYGRSVHHCPYCDGWEHRGQRLVAFGPGSAAVGLAESLRTWSENVTACTDGQSIESTDRERLAQLGVQVRYEKVVHLHGHDGVLEQLEFDAGPRLACDALFFNTGECQRSGLPGMLGCESDDKGLVVTEQKQRTCVDGLFLAGDADGDVQFSIVAAAEGAIAATAINRELQDEDLARLENSSSTAGLVHEAKV
jgi:thioredoxin reductase